MKEEFLCVLPKVAGAVSLVKMSMSMSMSM